MTEITCTHCHDAVHPTAIATPVDQSRAWCDDCARSVELPDWAEQLRRAALALIDAHVCSAVTCASRDADEALQRLVEGAEPPEPVEL